MGDNKLYLVLLLSIIVLADAQDEDAQCLLAKRYRSFHKYEYLYEAESLNGLNEALNGHKASCKVEIEVPGTCHYVVHTKECTLSEVSNTDEDGNPVFRPAAGADKFKAAMEKNPLKVIVEGDNDVKLFPEDDELINILNIKRGIISALAVPVLEEERNKRMPTIFGLCKTDYTVNARGDIATDVTLTRDLSRCDNFRPIKDHTSPLALISGMNYPLAQLFGSKQTCNYKFDNQQKHMTSGVCTENHQLLPFSHKTHGVTNVGKQTVSLLGVTEHNDRVFDHNEANRKPLHLDSSVDMSPIQDENAILDVLRELAGLSQTTHGHKRAHLAQKLVSMIRKANADTLSAALPDALEVSRSLTYQALFQCGTPECNIAMMQILRTTGISTAEIDATVYAMGLVPNPSRSLVMEMLKMARFKPSKLIYYATSNAVRRLYTAEGKVTPEIQAAANYVLEEIDDCTGDQDHIYLTLRVTGNMAAAVGAASSALKSAVIQCISQPAASPEVQQAAIQVFRLTPIPEEGREVLMRVILDRDASVQKRVAAYLILMKDPQPAELTQLIAALPSEQNEQAKSFFISHMTNILSSTVPETSALKQKILDVLQGNEIGNVMDPIKFSRNYKIGSLEGNTIFEKESKLPREVMLEMSLNAFGYDIDMFEVGMEGKGLEPTIEALFGPNGFFPDTIMKTIFFAADKMPSQVNEVLKNIIPELRNARKKRQASQNIIREITQNVEKLIQDLKAQDTPEAMIYLRLLGAELGYLKMKDMDELAYAVSKMVDNLLKMFPTDFIRSLYSSTDNELFLHYIFMDNEFYLPTGPGVPLRVALSGTFTPGVKGGLKVARDMSEISFMPSVGVEFVTEIGTHLPDYVQSGLEMHTSIYHESGLRAQVALTRSQIKLTIPAPKTRSKLLSIANNLYSIVGNKIRTVPAMMDHYSGEECRPLFPGLNHCVSVHFSYAMSNDDSPYFPLSGNSGYETELRPTGEVSEYTATITYAHENMVDKVTVEVKAEGTPTEATAEVMFNRKKYSIFANLQIPENLDVGLRIDTAAPSTANDAHSIMIEFLNNNIAEASLIGLAKIDAMKEAMLQVQLHIPSLEADAKMTANLKRAEDLILELESDIKFSEITSLQKLILKYGDERIRAEVKSDFSSETNSIIAEFDKVKAEVNNFLDQHLGQTEMTIRDALASSVEVTNNYLEASNIPFVEDLRVPAFPEIELPRTLFMKIEAGAEYQFGKHYYTVTFPLPLGGKSSKDLNFPPAFTTPKLAVPELDLDLASISIPIPEIVIPESLTVTLPILGMAEVSGKLSSNLYTMEATASAGRDPTEYLSYSAKLEANGTGPVDILSFRVQGSALLSGPLSDILKAEMNTAVHHKLIEARVNIVEEMNINEMSMKSSSKFVANSPLAIQASLEHTGQLKTTIDEISGDSNFKGSFVTGPVNGDATLTQTFALFPLRSEANIQSSLKVDSAVLQVTNSIEATVASGELSVQSNTDAFGNMLTHAAQVTFMQSRLAVKSDASVLVLGQKIQNIAEASISAGDAHFKIETTTDHSEDHIKSLITATLDENGLVIKSNASAKLADHTATQKVSLSLNKNGLATSGTTSLNSGLFLRNTFSGSLDFTKASLSAKTNSKFVGIELNNDMSMSASTSSLDLACKSQGTFAKDLWYKNDIAVTAEPFSATVNINNDLMILPVQIKNDAVFKAEPYKADLAGSIKLTLGAEELKHTYEMKYADLTATTKCSTTGKLMGAHMSHDTEMEIAGLSVRFTNNGNFNSQPVRFTTNLQATAVPFRFNLNALTNGDGELNLFGKQSAQIFSKILLKAEPLALAHSHECRLSTKHEFNDATIETNFDHKVDTVLTPSEQSTTVRVKSKVNNNEISQDVNAYNNDKRIGLEVSGVFTNAHISDQDLSVSAFLKYDKNTENHVINLPFIESLPAVFESIKITAVTMIESLQNYIKSEDFMDKIQSLLQHVSELNLEDRAAQLKNNLIAYAQDCPITFEALEASVLNLRTVVQKMRNEVEKIVREMIENGAPVFQQLGEKLNALMEEFDISSLLLSVIEAIEDVIKEIDLMNLKDSNLAFLHDLNEEFVIKDMLGEIISDLKDMIANFDKARFVEEVKIVIFSVQSHIENVMANLPTEEITMMANKLRQLITELDITGKCKMIYSSVRDILVNYEIDKKIEALLDKIVDLLKQFKINETVQVLADTLKSIEIPFLDVLDEATTYVKTTEIKDIIEDLNNFLNVFIEKMRSFDYNAFVDEANQIISEWTTKLNDLIVSLELPQKLEAAREFSNSALSSISASSEELKSVKFADVMKTLKDIIDNVVFKNIKAFVMAFKENTMGIDLWELFLQLSKDVSDLYIMILTEVSEEFSDLIEFAQEIFGDEPFFTELKQIIDGVITGLMTAEFENPSFTIPFTDLFVPSWKFNLQQLRELPAEIEIPQFTILDIYIVPAITFKFDDIKQILSELIDFFMNFDIEMLTTDPYIRELTLKYLPDFSAISLPEITIPDISFPDIPKLRNEYILNIPLQIPEIKLPKIPSVVVLPAFGKLYSEIRLRSPVYTFRTNAEIQNSTDNEQMHHFTAFITSLGTSPRFPILNYNLDSTARIGIPRMSRLIIAETLKFVHSALTVEHQASVTLYGLSAQATAQTRVKANTTPYKADLVNKAFFAVEGGMSASLTTSYKHQLDFPYLSMTSEVDLTHNAVAVQKAATIDVKIDSVCTNKVRHPEFPQDSSYKGVLHLNTDLRKVKLTITEDLDSSTLKMKATISVDAVAFSHIDYNGQLETKSPFIKNSVVVVSGRANLGDLKVEVEAKHDTELVGDISGTFSNAFHLLVRPIEIVVDFQNKGNAKANLEESLSAKVDLQNDYSLIINTMKQRINTLALVRFNQYKYNYNFTVDNDNAETGVYASVNGETDLEFLKVPINIPEIIIPGFDFTIPRINGLNLYEHFGLKHLLTTTKHAIDADAKILYQRSRVPPIIDLGLITVPSIGNLNSEISFKSSVFSINSNAGIHGDDDLVIRIAATSTSVYESLKAKLEGTSRLTSKRGLKVANSFSLENNHVKGSHNSTLSLNTDNLDAVASVSTFAKVDLPIFTFEANHKLNSNTKTNPKAESTMSIEYTFDVPIIKAVGRGDAEHTLKLDGTFSFVSAESTTKGMIDGTLLENGIVKGTLDNEASIYINSELVRSKLKTDGNINVNHEDLKVMFDVNENLELEAALSRVYTVLSIVSNNEVNIAALKTKGKHAAKATIDLAPMSSLTADVELDLSQPNTFGDLTIYEKTVVDITLYKQTIAYTTDMASPVYSVTIGIVAECGAPVFKVDFKSSAKSPAVLLAYDLDSYISTVEEDGSLTATAKASFEHRDFNIDFKNVITLSEPSHTLNVDIISPTFTNVNLEYTARRGGISAYASSPSAGFFGFQLNVRSPSQMNTRLYGRYMSAPENDIDFVTLSMDGDAKILATYNQEALSGIFTGLMERLPILASTITNFGEKYGICSAMQGLKTTIVSALTEAFTAVYDHAPELSQLSVLFRNVIVQYQKAIKSLLTAAVKFLRETQIILPGMEAATLPEICQKIKSNVFVVVEQIVKEVSDNLEAYLASVSTSISAVQVTLPSGEVVTGEHILDYVQNNLKLLVTYTVNTVKQMEGLDMVLEKLSATLEDVVEKAQDLVDTIKSDVVESVALYVNKHYTDFITLFKRLIEKADALLTIDNFNAIVEQCMELIMFALNELTDLVSTIVPVEPGALVKNQNGRLEFELPLPFHF